MNFVKQFEHQDLLALQRCPSIEYIHHLLSQKGIDTNTVSSLIIQLYQFATINNYDLQQKQQIINLTIKILTQLPTTHSKELFLELLNKSVDRLGQRDENCKTYFDLVQIATLKEFLASRILPYYELYEIVLDNHPHFLLQTQNSGLIKNLNEKPLKSGNAVQVENIEVLKQFLGIRAAKEEKKDPKKK